jgi:excinuclease ABC subunit C
LGVTGVSVCGLAKRLEEVWQPDEAFPVVLPRTSEGLYLLQRVRDEAHRFAITFHRQRRSKRMTTSALDSVPGLGEVRRKALLRRFGSVKRLAAAGVDEIAEVPGIGRRTAEAIAAALADPPVRASAPADPPVRASAPADPPVRASAPADPPGDDRPERGGAVEAPVAMGRPAGSPVPAIAESGVNPAREPARDESPADGRSTMA